MIDLKTALLIGGIGASGAGLGAGSVAYYQTTVVQSCDIRTVMNEEAGRMNALRDADSAARRRTLGLAPAPQKSPLDWGR